MSAAAASELKAAAEASIARFALIFAQGIEEGSLSYDGSAQHAAMGFFAMLEGLQTLCRASGDASSFGQAAATYIRAITISP